MIIILAVVGFIFFFPFGNKLWKKIKAEEGAEIQWAKAMEERDPATARQYAEAVKMAELARNGYRNSYR